jgi:DNA polymerase-3 subunit epsilon
VVQEFIGFIRGAELIIHNAPFDVGFLNHEIELMDSGLEALESYCRVIDSLALARNKHPGQRNNLDALCKRYEVDNSQRELHGALLDAEILADVYLAMTGGQTRLQLGTEEQESVGTKPVLKRLDQNRPPLKVVRATAAELQAHGERLQAIAKESGSCVWPGES